MTRARRPRPLSAQQYKVLAAIAASPDITATVLIARVGGFGTSSRGMTQTAASLVRRGLAKRRVSYGLVRYSITAAGRRELVAF